MCQECMYAAMAAATAGVAVFKNRKAILSSFKFNCKHKTLNIKRKEAADERK